MTDTDQLQEAVRLMRAAKALRDRHPDRDLAACVADARAVLATAEPEPSPLAGAVVLGPDDCLVLGLPDRLSLIELDRWRERIERAGLAGRVLVADGIAQLAVIPLHAIQVGYDVAAPKTTAGSSAALGTATVTPPAPGRAARGRGPTTPEACDV